MSLKTLYTLLAHRHDALSKARLVFGFADPSAAALQAIKQFTQGSSGASAPQQEKGGNDMVSKVSSANPSWYQLTVDHRDGHLRSRQGES